MENVETRLVYGFLDAGKTIWIQDCIFHDYFHKYGTTLILAFEDGEAEYDEKDLLEYRTHVAYYEGSEDIAAFCLRQTESWLPDRVYVEMNSMMAGLRQQLPAALRIASSSALIDFGTLKTYLENLRAQLYEMVRASQTVTFRNCPSKELLAPYSQAFRLMNQNAVYLRQDPTGYHERAFDLFVPFDLAAAAITIGEAEYLAFYLDACEHPEHYAGKEIRFDFPLEIRDGVAGRTVMTCCMADIQFMGFPLTCKTDARGWISLAATGKVVADGYGQKRPALCVRQIAHSRPPATLILNAV